MRSPDQAPASADVLLISNGNGEDSIAASVAARLPSELATYAYPLVGPGVAFDGLCTIIGPRVFVPSEGWRHTKGSLLRDMGAGLPAAIVAGTRYLRSLRGRFRKVVLIGDGAVPAFCWLAGLHIDLYVDVFKTGFAHRYNYAERLVLGHVCSRVYCRDDMLATMLRKSRIDAHSPGNIMMDVVPRAGFEVGPFRCKDKMVLLLPGSREVVSENLGMQIAVLKALPVEKMPDVFVAVAPGLDPSMLAKGLGAIFEPGNPDAEKAYLGTINAQGVRLHLVAGALGELVDHSDLVLSQAGTATQQAVGLGKLVITFDRAENRRKRMQDEQALMGEGRILTSFDAGEASALVARLLDDPAECARRGAIGRSRMGGSGVLEAVIADIVA